MAIRTQSFPHPHSPQRRRAYLFFSALSAEKKTYLPSAIFASLAKRALKKLGRRGGPFFQGVPYAVQDAVYKGRRLLGSELSSYVYGFVDGNLWGNVFTVKQLVNSHS
jgi:hypothetical protein